MALKTGLELRQGQTLALTPQMILSIRILQMSSLDLTAWLAEEVQKNPLLEMSELTPEAERERGEGEGERERERETAKEAGAHDDDTWPTETSSPEALSEPYDADMQDIYPETDLPAATSEVGLSMNHITTGGAGAGGGGEEDYNLENVLAGEKTWLAHLEEQLALATSDPAMRLVLQHLISLLDEAGYMREDLAGVAQTLGVSQSVVESALTQLQRFEPTGIGARDLRECLALQLIEKDRYDPAMQAFIENIELMVKGDFPRLEKLCRVSREDLLDMIAEVRMLEPKPAARFSSGNAQTLIADILVSQKPQGDWQIELNPDALPKVLINRTYLTRTGLQKKNSPEQAYISEQMQNANWLVKMLDQRAQTILKVATRVVLHQDAFLLHGVEHLKPLTLKTVADEISMHESTVSRVTSNKYMMTPRGIFELKYFFSNALGGSESQNDEGHAAEAVRGRIRKMIEEETAKAVLSDDAIAERLKAMGIDVARRTVAKYREAMGIPTSSKRKRLKRFGLEG